MVSVELKVQFLVALDRERGNVTRAARQVGVSRSTAHEWTRQAGLQAHGRGGHGRHPRRAEYDLLRASGVPQREAARQIGIHRRTAQDWDAGIRKIGDSRLRPDGRRIDYKTGMTTLNAAAHRVSVTRIESPLHPRYLTVVEREQIADLRRSGVSLRQIGRQLGRAASTIKREVDRHGVASGYHPHRAQRMWTASRARPKTSKLSVPGPLRSYVIDKLALQWSPEQICHSLLKNFPDDGKMRVSPETIYQAIYLQTRGGLRRDVPAALRTGRMRRVPHRSSQFRTPRFVDSMMMISERPPEIADRSVAGHWEGDLIVGTRSESAIVTLVERSSRYVLLGHLPGGHTAEEVRAVLVTLIGSLPSHLRRSLTWDQGCEMAAHKQFSAATGIPVYFCDPHSPWQRGSNENTNGLLRQYFPKGTSLPVHGAVELQAVEHRLNTRPRKTLGWKTPIERLCELSIADQVVSGQSTTTPTMSTSASDGMSG